MNLRSWLRERSRNRRRRKAAKENEHEALREFVYLDEVSVFSLLASRIGALATDVTDTESSSLTSEIKGSAGVASPVAKANVSSGISSGQTTGTQVMRKSTVQSTFKELYGYVKDTLAMSPPGPGQNPPSMIQKSEDLLREGRKASSWVLDADTLKRGQLIEVEVELEADESFRASVIFTTLLEFMEQLPQMPENVDREAMLNAVTGTRLLDKLLAGLVPVRGKVVDYSHVSIEGHDLVVHRHLLQQGLGFEVEARPLYVVGVAEEDLFWRDVRRVLFSGARYQMLCRIGRDGVHPDWTPVKLMDVLEGVVPALGGLVDEIPELLTHMSEEEAAEEQPSQIMRRALQQYAMDLTASYEHPLTLDDLAARGLPTPAQCEGYGTIEARRDAFAAVTKALSEEFEFAPQPEVVAGCRSAALIEAGLLAEGAGVAMQDVVDASSADRSKRYIDSEIVAIYW